MLTAKVNDNQQFEIDAKLNYAQTYLIIELTNLTLSDSSDYYEKKLKELKELEGKKLKGKDSIMLLNEKEKSGNCGVTH